MHCGCCVPATGSGSRLDAFSELRQHCPALREVLLPDDFWPKFLQWHQQEDTVAAHCSISLLAWRRGCLSRVTGPIHRYLLSESGISTAVRKQYAKDFREKWMLDSAPLGRHQLSRTFRGRLAELQYAAWLEDHNHSILELEATRTGPDIVAQSPAGVTMVCEVKHIGIEDPDFEVSVAALHDQPAGRPISPYRAMNYLLYRVYEASLQLRSASGERVAVIVVDDSAWFRFDLQLRKAWIDWSAPAFLCPDEEWLAFMRKQRHGSPSPSDLRDTLAHVSRVLVYRQTADFLFHLECCATPPRLA